MRGMCPRTIASLLLVYALGQALGSHDASLDVKKQPFSPCDLPYEQQPFSAIKPELHRRHPPKAGPWEETLTAYSAGPWPNGSSSYLARFQRYMKKRLMSSFGLQPYVGDREYGPVRAGVDWIFRTEFALPQRLIDQSVSTRGERSRLRRVMHKLTQDRPIGIAVIGGSVSEGAGTHGGGDWVHEAYVGRVFDWLQTTFPGRPHVTRNGAIGGTTSVYYGQCVQDFVPEEDVDLVIVEFTVNDKQLLTVEGNNASESGRQSFELLMRKLLSYKNRPAVLVLHYWSPGVNTAGFDDTHEGLYESVVQYYGVQSLSWRNTMFHAVMSNATAFRRDVVFCDVVHPTPLGHRYLGDMVIAFLQDAIVDILVNPLTEEDKSTALGALPPPMMEGTDPEDSQCWRNDDLKAVVHGAEAWSWVDEGKRGRHKWGYVTTVPNTTLDFEFSSECSSNTTGNVTVGIGHLKSYERMGLAEISCFGGCTCLPALMNGSWESHTSQENWQNIIVSQSPTCRVRVTSRQAPNGDSKVKLTSLLKSCIDSSFSRQTFGDREQVFLWDERGTVADPTVASSSNPRGAGSANPEDASSANPTLSPGVISARAEPYQSGQATRGSPDGEGVAQPGGGIASDVISSRKVHHEVEKREERVEERRTVGGLTRELAEMEGGHVAEARSGRHHPRRVRVREGGKQKHRQLS